MSQESDPMMDMSEDSASGSSEDEMARPRGHHASPKAKAGRRRAPGVPRVRLQTKRSAGQTAHHRVRKLRHDASLDEAVEAMGNEVRAIIPQLRSVRMRYNALLTQLKHQGPGVPVLPAPAAAARAPAEPVPPHLGQQQEVALAPPHHLSPGGGGGGRSRAGGGRGGGRLSSDTAHGSRPLSVHVQEPIGLDDININQLLESPVLRTSPSPFASALYAASAQIVQQQHQQQHQQLHQQLHQQHQQGALMTGHNVNHAPVHHQHAASALIARHHCALPTTFSAPVPRTASLTGMAHAPQHPMRASHPLPSGESAGVAHAVVPMPVPLSVSGLAAAAAAQLGATLLPGDVFDDDDDCGVVDVDNDCPILDDDDCAVDFLDPDPLVTSHHSPASPTATAAATAAALQSMPWVDPGGASAHGGRGGRGSSRRLPNMLPAAPDSSSGGGAASGNGRDAWDAGTYTHPAYGGGSASPHGRRSVHADGAGLYSDMFMNCAL